MTQTLAFLYLAICLGVVVFQICLIAGAPWGRLTQGGTHDGQLPARGRIIAGVSCFVMLALALSILSAAGQWPHWPIWTGWVALATTVVSTIMNFATPSVAERKVWGPVTLVMLASAAFVMLTR